MSLRVSSVVHAILRLARLAPAERVLVLLEEMIDRLGTRGLDVAAERAQAMELRRRAAEKSALLAASRAGAM